MISRAIRFSLIIAAALRIGTSLFLAEASMLVKPDVPPAPFSQQVVQELTDRGELSRLFLLPWYRWDTVHYIEIAEKGYRADLQNTVWPPLYPALIHWFDWVLEIPMLSALVISSLAAWAAFALMYILVAENWTEALARRVVFWMAVFPSAFFLVAGYTESLFLAFAIGSLLAARHRRWLLAGFLGALAALTRIQGVLLAIPLAWEGLVAFSRWRRSRQTLWPMASNTALILCSAGLIPLCFEAFSLYVHFSLKAPWPWQTLAAGWQEHTGWPWAGLIGNMKLMSHQQVDIHNLALFYDLFLAIWAIFLFYKGSANLPVSFSLLTIVILAPALMKLRQDNTLASLLRYVLSAFPLFISLDSLLHRRLVQTAWLIFSLLSQGLLLLMFYRWMWVA